MFQHVPNALTALRLLLAGVFFGMLSFYQHQIAGPHGDVLWLNIAFFVYLIALITDFLDGFLARRWKVEGAFGRVVDPFVDKVLVLGSFIFFAGKNFIIPQSDPAQIPTNVQTITGVVPWMVVVILARELLVTSLRGSSEASGEKFTTQFAGKFKMAAQSVTILVILLYVNYREELGPDWQHAATFFRDFCIWGTLVITIGSGLLYIQRAVSLYRKNARATAQGKNTEKMVEPLRR
ncbi:MAG: CDP-alcohol phosphatidyltransferase family protein [Tepidisphaeraceae bacterium]|jgi:CDP-diacylglycerol--glycerol-3-phosphate 3-phosphatidyltransferase